MLWGRRVPYLVLAKVTKGVSPIPGLREPSPSPHSPQEVLAEPFLAMKRLKPFSYSFHPGAPFDSEQAGRPLEPGLLGAWVHIPLHMYHFYRGKGKQLVRWLGVLGSR